MRHDWQEETQKLLLSPSTKSSSKIAIICIQTEMIRSLILERHWLCQSNLLGRKLISCLLVSNVYGSRVRLFLGLHKSIAYACICFCNDFMFLCLGLLDSVLRPCLNLLWRIGMNCFGILIEF